MFIGIDQSYSGFAITGLYEDGQHTTEVAKFDPKRYGTGVDRLISIQDWFTSSLLRLDCMDTIEHVCMEGYANGSKFGREVAGELGYATKRLLRRWHPQQLLPTIVPPTSLKKFVTGKGNAKKNEMLLGVYKKWGVEYSDDNLADAYSLARVGEALDTDVPLAKYQQEVLTALSN